MIKWKLEKFNVHFWKSSHCPTGFIRVTKIPPHVWRYAYSLWFWITQHNSGAPCHLSWLRRFSVRISWRMRWNDELFSIFIEWMNNERVWMGQQPFVAASVTIDLFRLHSSTVCTPIQLRTWHQQNRCSPNYEFVGCSCAYRVEPTLPQTQSTTGFDRRHHILAIE